MIWLQWMNRRRKTVAHAINSKEDMLTGKRRAVCGSLVPVHAVKWDGKASRDPFCLKIVKDGPSKRRLAKLKKLDKTPKTAKPKTAKRERKKASRDWYTKKKADKKKTPVGKCSECRGKGEINYRAKGVKGGWAKKKCEACAT